MKGNIIEIQRDFFDVFASLGLSKHEASERVIEIGVHAINAVTMETESVLRLIHLAKVVPVLHWLNSRLRQCNLVLLLGQRLHVVI